MTDQPLVPLALVAAQLGQEAWQLAAHVREHMVIDPENGLDSVPTAISRQLTNEHRAAKAAQTERVRRDLAQRQHSLHPGCVHEPYANAPCCGITPDSAHTPS
jgi:hypothetical protein